MNFKIRSWLSIALILILFASCSGNSKTDSSDSSSTKKITKSNNVNGSTYSKKSVDSLIRIGALSPDSMADAPPSQAEERIRLSKTYDDVKIIDSTFINNNDTLHFHSKYYCLKSINLIEPKLYDPNTKNPKEFLTHPFVVDICLMHNKDTVLNRQFKASDFNPFFKDNFGGDLKKYGSILGLHFSKISQDKNLIALSCSISIPATDIGIGADLIIDKNGSYKIKTVD